MSRPAEREKVLDQMENMVVKVVNESGGYGMLMGPSSTAQEPDEFKKKILANPRSFIAQPVIPLSQHLCYLDDELQSRHLDLRPFIIYGEEIQVVPGGLTRVAFLWKAVLLGRQLTSQGGGSKDTWVVEATS